MYPESDLLAHDEIMGSLDSVCSEETPTQCNSVQNNRWRPRDAPTSSTTLASSSDATTSSEENSIFVPETPSPYLKSKRRLCDSESNSPKRVCWSSTGDEIEEEVADSSLPSLSATSYDTPDLDFCEISLTENMNSLLHQDSSSSSPGLGGTSASTEDEEETAPIRASRRPFGRTILLSSDDSDLDLVLGSPRPTSGNNSSSSTGNSTVASVSLLNTNRRNQTNSNDRLSRGFSQTSSSSGERSGGTVFHGRRCRQRVFSGKKHARGREDSSSPSSASQGPTEPDSLPLQQDLSSPHTPRRSRIFSSRRYHHVSPRARLEERTANQCLHAAPGAIFSTSPTFRRDDPGRRPLTRSSHASQGRRTVPPSSPQSRTNFCRYTESMPDVFDADSDDSTEFFTATSSPSENEGRRRRVSGSPAQRRREAVAFASDSGLRGDSRMRRRRPRFSLIRSQINNDNSDDDVRVVFPAANFSPTTVSSSGRRQRRGTRSRRRHLSSEREISSPDPVQQVQQMEEDERMARMLQAQFDAEVQPQRVIPAAVTETEEDLNIVVDQDSSEGSTGSSDTTTFSSESSSSRSDDNVGQSPYSRRLQRNGAGNWRRRGASQRNWQVTRAVRRPPHMHANHLINILAFSVSQSGSEDYDYEALWDLVQVVGDVVPRGLVPQQLNRLPTRHYEEDDGKSKECQVCLSEFEKQDLLRILPCFHEFHAACIDKWLPMNRTCPVCRAEVEID